MPKICTLFCAVQIKNVRVVTSCVFDLLSVQSYWSGLCTFLLVIIIVSPTLNFYFFLHFIIPLGKFGLPYPGKATAAARAALPRVLQVHARSFHVSIIHRTLTWTTGSLMCVCDHSYACMYTRGLGTLTASQ